MKKKRGKRRREEKDLVIQGRVSFGPTWFWADLVLGRLGLGRVGFGPSWLEPRGGVQAVEPPETPRFGHI